MTEEQEEPEPIAAPETGPDVLAQFVASLGREGRALVRYRVRAEIARGGMGKILRVWDEDLRRELAMKVALRDPDARDTVGTTGVGSKALGRFLEEAQVTGQLDHPGIVPVHEIGVDSEGRVFFTMRLVSGQTFEEVIDAAHRGDPDWTFPRAVGVLSKVCDAMAYAHAKSVIHRDLKPANLMVGGFGEAYVMDWGLARVVDGEGAAEDADEPDRPSGILDLERLRGDETVSSELVTMAGDVLGTPAYMSPEQARGDVRAMGPLSDVYSMGAILYHLVAGHPPYAPPGRKTDVVEVWTRARMEPPEPVEERAPRAPQELCAICAKAMARAPEERYASMQALADDLRAYLEGRVVRAYERGALAELKKWVLRNRALAATVAVALLTIVTGSLTASFVLRGKNVELRASERVAQERADRLLRLSDVKRLEDLGARAERLWPAHPENARAIEDWVEEASRLRERLAGHRATLATLASAPRPWAVEQQWQLDVQAQLVERLEAFVDAEDGALAGMVARLDFADTVAERSTDGPEAAARWADAAARAADPDGPYGGLALAPQLGLLPLGPDPASGLLEFAHLQTGAVPARDPETGALAFGPDSGLVFVLVPGGTFAMGAQRDDPAGANHDPAADERAQPVHLVTLDPFFLSKYEMTQGQWERFTGSNPSTYGPDRDLGGTRPGLDHPVENVDWNECALVTSRLGLALPTEAQWEYAARAGTRTPWWTGADRASLVGAANLADQAGARLGANWPAIAEWPALDDGFPVHAPAGALRANPWGFGQTLGNLWEWCRDQNAGYDVEPRPGDGLREAPDAPYRINRGGSFSHGAAYASASWRNMSAPELKFNNIGLRPARALGSAE